MSTQVDVTQVIQGKKIPSTIQILGREIDRGNFTIKIVSTVRTDDEEYLDDPAPVKVLSEASTKIMMGREYTLADGTTLNGAQLIEVWALMVDEAWAGDYDEPIIIVEDEPTI